MAGTSEEDTSASRVTELFIEYLQAGEIRSESNLDELCERAGHLAEELRGRIEEHEGLKSLGPKMLGSEEQERPVRLGRFEELELIGEGGMGSVYVAHDTALQRKVALKIVSSPDGRFGKRGAWALNEARSLARLEHPGVVQVLDVVDNDEDRVFLVMELLRGPSMAQVIDELRARRSADGAEAAEPAQGGSVALKLQGLRARLHCLADIARALAFCHDRGVLHRDIKPSNVLFSRTGEPKLIDFGLAHIEDADDETKVDTTQAFRGTPAYFSPEQIENGRTGADPRCEIFSFGTLCYELLSLEHPFRRPTRQATLDAVLLARPEPLRKHDASIPADVQRVVHHCLEREPADRYPNLDAAAADLAALLENRPISVEDPSAARVLKLWVKRHKPRIVASSILAGLALVLSGSIWTAVNLSEHGRVREAIAEVRTQGLRLPNDFRAQYIDLLSILADAREFDAGPMRSLVFPNLTGPANTRTQELSRHLGEVARAEYEDRIVIWMPIVSFDEVIYPEGSHNQVLRDRGQVEFELEGNRVCTLFVQQAEADAGELMAARVYLEYVELAASPEGVLHVRDLPPGIFRLVAWSGDEVFGEVEFNLESSWGPLQRLKILQPRTPMTAFESSTLTYPLHKGGGIEIFVAAFGAGELVTNAEYESYCETTGRELPTTVSVGGGEACWPAGVSWRQALAYAQWKGGRHPTSAEVSAMFQRDPDFLEIDGQATGEWISDGPPVPGTFQVTFRSYDTLDGKPWERLPLLTKDAPVDGDQDPAITKFVGFRVVTSSGDREAITNASRLRRP